jgi:BarA-like signal transduction histidine kinase
VRRGGSLVIDEARSYQSSMAVKPGKIRRSLPATSYQIREVACHMNVNSFQLEQYKQSSLILRAQLPSRRSHNYCMTISGCPTAHHSDPATGRDSYSQSPLAIYDLELVQSPIHSPDDRPTSLTNPDIPGAYPSPQFLLCVPCRARLGPLSTQAVSSNAPEGGRLDGRPRLLRHITMKSAVYECIIKLELCIR